MEECVFLTKNNCIFNTYSTQKTLQGLLFSIFNAKIHKNIKFVGLEGGGILSDRFGSKQVVITHYMDILLQIVPVKTGTDVKQLRAVLSTNTRSHYKHCFIL